MADQSIWARLWALRGTSFSKSQQFAIGLMAFGAIIAVTLPLLLLAQHYRATAFMEVPGKIVWVEERCDLLAKDSSSFTTGRFERVRTTSCAEADLFLASNVDEEWRADRRTYVSLDYVASGIQQNVMLEATLFDLGELVPGGTVPLFVNPNDLDDVETGITMRNMILTALLAVASAGVAALGWFLFRWLTPELDIEDEGEDDQLSSIT